MAAVQEASDDVRPELYRKLRDINRNRLCSFLDEMKASVSIVKEILKEEDGPSDAMGGVPSPNKSFLTDSKSANTFHSFPVKPEQKNSSFVTSYKSGKLEDKDIDDNYKVLLVRRRNGAYLSPEIVAHLEYFRNTLNLGLKSETENPFDLPDKYPALQFTGESQVQRFSQSMVTSEEDDDLIEDDDIIDLEDLESSDSPVK